MAFHIAQSGKSEGNPVRCPAKKSCTLKNDDGSPAPHFTTKEEGLAHIEKQAQTEAGNSGFNSNRKSRDAFSEKAPANFENVGEALKQQFPDAKIMNYMVSGVSTVQFENGSMIMLVDDMMAGSKMGPDKDGYVGTAKFYNTEGNEVRRINIEHSDNMSELRSSFDTIAKIAPGINGEKSNNDKQEFLVKLSEDEEMDIQDRVLDRIHREEVGEGERWGSTPTHTRNILINDAIRHTQFARGLEQRWGGKAVENDGGDVEVSFKINDRETQTFTFGAFRGSGSYTDSIIYVSETVDGKIYPVGSRAFEGTEEEQAEKIDNFTKKYLNVAKKLHEDEI